MAKERTFSLAQDRQNKEIGEVNRDNQRLQEQLDKLDHELSLVNAAIKDVEDDSEVIKNLNEEFTTPSNKGIFDKNQEKLTSRILELNATVSRLQSEAKKAKPKVSQSEIEKAQRELAKTEQRLELEQQSRQASLQEKQDLLAEREREKPRLEKIMRDNAKWELRQSEMFFDDLKKEKKEYLYKLEQLNKKVEERKNKSTKRTNLRSPETYDPEMIIRPYRIASEGETSVGSIESLPESGLPIFAWQIAPE